MRSPCLMLFCTICSGLCNAPFVFAVLTTFSIFFVDETHMCLSQNPIKQYWIINILLVKSLKSHQCPIKCAMFHMFHGQNLMTFQFFEGKNTDKTGQRLAEDGPLSWSSALSTPSERWSFGLMSWSQVPRPLNEDEMLRKMGKKHEKTMKNNGRTMITWGSPGDKLQKLWIYSHWSPIWEELFRIFQCISIVSPRVNLQKDVGSHWFPG